MSYEPHEVSLPRMGKVHIACTIRCVNDHCPRPQLLTLKALTQVNNGDVIELVSDNPATVETIPAMMLTLDGKHLATIRDGDLWRLYLRKGLAP